MLARGDGAGPRSAEVGCVPKFALDHLVSTLRLPVTLQPRARRRARPSSAEPETDPEPKLSFRARLSGSGSVTLPARLISEKDRAGPTYEKDKCTNT